MNGDAWADGNNRYLAASLHWLRLKLRRLAAAANADVAAGRAPSTQVVVATSAPAPAARTWWSGRPASSAPPPPVLEASAQAPPLPQAASDDKAIDAAAAKRADAAQIEPPPALLVLARRLGLDAFEADTLLLCAAAELDPAIAALIASAQGQASRASPTFALALQLFDDPSWDALSPHRPLRYARLVDINQPGATPLTGAALRVDERVMHYIKGLNAIDERLASLFAPSGGDERALLSSSQREVADAVLHQLKVVGARSQIPLVTLLGVDAASKLDTARTVCEQLDRHLYRLPLDALPAARADVENLARLWQRECLMLPIALYVDADELDGASADAAASFHTLVSRDLGLAFVALRQPLARPLSNSLAIEVDKPSVPEQHAAWLEGLSSALPDDDAARGAAALASQFDLSLRDLQHALALGAADDEQPRVDALWSACRQWTRPKLDQLAQRIDARATWDDLVLSDESMALLRQIAQQVQNRYKVYEQWGFAKSMNRGLGISALFAGESGTGKTMAAEVIANALQLSLYRIDLSAVVSKYIGETEKNLRRLFDAAELGGAILFFDEADALFGKRSEVKDSHDRYANIEINYLLQRMEAFAGLAILATNMKGALDLAFMRRLRFVVQFPYPGPAERKRMWQRALPSGVPTDGIDYDRLARFHLSGGNIHSVALNAAFMAAARSTPVTQALLQASVRSELRKLDKAVNEAEFR